MPAGFDDLQERFSRRFAAGGFGDFGHGTIVVIPSLTFPEVELRKITAIEHYEERLLCTLLGLSDPQVRMVYVTSTEVHAAIVDYYLSFVRDSRSARRRLHLVVVGDPSPRPLSEKLLERPGALRDVRRRVADPDDTFIFPFNVTPVEQEVAEALGLPLFGPRPELGRFGTKSGARAIARRAGVPVLEGSEDVRSLEQLERAIHSLRARRPDARAVVVKLNNGFSGQGNAIIDVTEMQSPIDRSPTVFCAEEESWASFAPKIAAEGAIVEEQLRDGGIASPSVQMRISPGGRVEVLSTHDQVLGGPDDQVYLGCRFPARRHYRDVIQTHALAVARLLAEEGVIGLFGVDFVVVPDGSGHAAYLSEINLRVGGTTHPFLTARGITEGSYDGSSGELLAGGKPVCYVASDNIKSARYVGITPRRALAALEASGLGYDDRTKSGATLHMVGALPRYGKLGATCLAGSVEEAAAMYDDVVGVLDGLAGDG